MGDSSSTNSTAPGVHDGTVVMVKNINDFPFRGFNAGDNITIIQNTNDLTFNAVDSLQISYDGGQIMDLITGPVIVNAQDTFPTTQFFRYNNPVILVYELSNAGVFLNGTNTQIQAAAGYIPPGTFNNSPINVTSLFKFVAASGGTILNNVLLNDTVYHYKLTAVYKTPGLPLATGSFDLTFKVERTGANPPVVTPGSLTLMADVNEPTFGPVVSVGANNVIITMDNALNPGSVWTGNVTMEVMALTYF